MTTTTQTQDLAAIVGNLDASIAELDRKITGHTAKLGELQQELASVQGNKANYQTDLATTQAEVQRHAGAVTQASTDATLAQGTSIAAQKQQELAAVREQLARAEAQLSTLQASFEHDSQAEQDTRAAIASLQGEIAGLVAEKSDAVASRERWAREHAEHVKQLHLAKLRECDDEIASLEAKLDQARAARIDAQAQMARDLSAWPELAEATLAEHGIFEPGPDARLLAARLAMLAALDEASPGAQQLAVAAIPLGNLQANGGLAGYRRAEARLRAQNGDFIHHDPLLQKYEQHVAEVERILAELRAKEQEVQASALVRQQTSS